MYPIGRRSVVSAAGADPERAVALCRRQRALCQQVGEIRAEALSLGLLGDACQALGRHEEAIAAFSEALSVFRSHVIRRHHALCLLKLGGAYMAMGNPLEAERSLRESLPIFRELRLAVLEERARQALQACGPALAG